MIKCSKRLINNFFLH